MWRNSGIFYRIFARHCIRFLDDYVLCVTHVTLFAWVRLYAVLGDARHARHARHGYRIFVKSQIFTINRGDKHILPVVAKVLFN